MSNSKLTSSLVSYYFQCDAKLSLKNALKANKVQVVPGSFGSLPSVGDRVVYRRIENDIVFYIVDTVSTITEPSGQVTVSHYGGLPPQGNEIGEAEWFIVKNI
jgi:hypothetical protein